MQNPLFPTSSSDNLSGDANSPLPDYLQTRPVQGVPVPPQPLQQQSYTPPAPVPAAPVFIPNQNASTDKPKPEIIKSDDPTRNAAADLVRQKLNAIYAKEPDAHAELNRIEATRPAVPLTKHQQYMQMLNESGKPWAAIQNEWHAYYQALPDDEKHQVWQEFYNSGRQQTFMPGAQPAVQPIATGPQPVVTPIPQPITHQPLPSIDLLAQAQAGNTFSSGYHAQQAMQPPAPQDVSAGHIQPVIATTPGGQFEPRTMPAAAASRPSVADIKQKLRDTVSAGGTSKGRQHFQSLAFGLMSGTVAVLFFMLLFFNEVVIAPFIQPSRTATETPIIVNTASAAVGKEPKVIIPKINVEIPVDYSQTTTNEDTLQKALNSGVIHYPTTVRPGQAGNAAFFGHSSNNILNPGKYKFAFLLLHKLSQGDTFYLTYEGKAYSYEVISMRVVDPTEIGVLGAVPNETSTATLITCDPPGTSLKRLVVVGRQTSPDPSGNAAPASPQTVPVQTATTNLPGNGPTLWSRMWNSIF